MKTKVTMGGEKNFKISTDDGVVIFYGHKINKDMTSINHEYVKFLFPLKYANFQINWELEDGSFESKRLGAGQLCIIPPMLTYQITCLNTSMIEIDMPIEFLEKQTGININDDTVVINEFIGVSDIFLYKLAQFIEYKIPIVSPNHDHFLTGVLSLLCHYYVSNFTENIETKEKPMRLDEIPCKKIQHALTYMNLNLTRLLSLEELSKEIKMSQYHFSRVFKKTIGFSPSKYHMLLRLDSAKDMLKRNMSVTEVSKKLGFSSPSHFTTTFTKAIGVPPKRFKDQN